MKVTIENTTQITHLNGVPARIWEGTTESGIPVMAFITRISPRIDPSDAERMDEFQLDLAEQSAPTADTQAASIRSAVSDGSHAQH